MIGKARENTDLAKALLDWPQPYLDAVANRLYYALYQAGWAFLERRGCQVPVHSGKMYFRHEELDDTLTDYFFQQTLGLPEDCYERLDFARNQRVQADYRRVPVSPKDIDDPFADFVEDVVHAVEQFVGQR